MQTTRRRRWCLSSQSVHRGPGAPSESESESLEEEVDGVRERYPGGRSGSISVSHSDAPSTIGLLSKGFADMIHSCTLQTTTLIVKGEGLVLSPAWNCTRGRAFDLEYSKDFMILI